MSNYPEQLKISQAKQVGRILVMDDEETVRALIGEILEEMGFRVGYAANGEEAIQNYREAIDSGDLFAAVIMDLTVNGGMGGREAMASILEIDPGAQGIVSSGYSECDVMSSYGDYGFAGMIRKPYRLEEIEAVIRSVVPEG